MNIQGINTAKALGRNNIGFSANLKIFHVDDEASDRQTVANIIYEVVAPEAGRRGDTVELRQFTNFNTGKESLEIENYNLCITDGLNGSGLDIARTAMSNKPKGTPTIVFSNDQILKPETEKIGAKFVNKIQMDVFKDLGEMILHLLYGKK